jgi:hypothetical protein
MIKFNPTKCQLLVFQSDNIRTLRNIVIIFQSTPIRAKGTATHLGNVIGPDVDENVIKTISDFNRRVNVLVYRFHCNFETKVKLFQSFCISLYGSVLWDLSGRSTYLSYTVWRKAVRKIISVHPRTHCALLPLIISWFPWRRAHAHQLVGIWTTAKCIAMHFVLQCMCGPIGTKDGRRLGIDDE